ncbi:MoaD/ThiS family protein [Ornithinicoccus hortensis]|uniref:Molybdopterin converting factor small subunit n=1 Tax=Ornithinicoccus hortensis TaxID=82346 RepID=A0A542YMB7_9MICO|nr:MoaD/ThiS family protein [Ornithinicoccus hortensis]TQL49227.1 molybdopterin converting factor small subunit [Ornithinicoccus hortensis]
MATVRYFAAAAEAAGAQEERVGADSLGELLQQLEERHGAELGRVLARSSLLFEGRYVDDRETPLDVDAVVDVLPPFAGG